MMNELSRFLTLSEVYVLLARSVRLMSTPLIAGQLNAPVLENI